MATTRGGLAAAFAFCAVAGASAPAQCAPNEAPVAAIVESQTAFIYNEPAENSAPAGQVARGRALKPTGERREGFVGVATKSGRTLWIKEADLRTAVAPSPSQPSATDDLAEGHDSPPPAIAATAATAETSEPQRAPVSAPGPVARRDYGLHYPPRATFDLGGAAGSFDANGSSYSYTELELGLNLYFAEWLDWRNALWARFVTGADNAFGLDTSVRGIAQIGDERGGVTAFAGPGWRFPNSGDGSPFAEAGLVLHLGGVHLGGGVRSFLHSWVTSGAGNETQVFLIVGGGGSL